MVTPGRVAQGLEVRQRDCGQGLMSIWRHVRFANLEVQGKPDVISICLERIGAADKEAICRTPVRYDPASPKRVKSSFKEHNED